MEQRELVQFFGGHFGGPLLAGEAVNLRYIPAAGGRVVNRFWPTFEQAAEDALRPWPEHHVHFGVNPRTHGDATKEGVTRIVVLHADLDVGKDKVFRDAGEAYDTLTGRSGLQLLKVPECIVDSGGGLHAYWRLEDPLPAVPGNVFRAEHTMMCIYRALGGTDAVQDVSRVMRVPGTINHKNGREARVLYVED